MTLDTAFCDGLGVGEVQCNFKGIPNPKSPSLIMMLLLSYLFVGFLARSMDPDNDKSCLLLLGARFSFKSLASTVLERQLVNLVLLLCFALSSLSSSEVADLRLDLDLMGIPLPFFELWHLSILNY